VASLSAISVRRRPTEITLDEVPDVTDVPDEVIVAADLDSGVVASVHYSGGSSTVGKNVVWDIVGESGNIVVSGDSGYLHYDDVTVTVGRPDAAPRTLAIPEEFTRDVPSLHGPAAGTASAARRAGCSHSLGGVAGPPPGQAEGSSLHPRSDQEPDALRPGTTGAERDQADVLSGSPPGVIASECDR
jgi:predicted dehydrogenase